MKDRTKLNAKYYFIPCWYNSLIDEISGKNKFWDVLLDIAIWYDVDVLQKQEFSLWVEDLND